MTLKLKRDQGEFHCPTCDQRSPFVRRLAREYLTVYFIPLIPLGVKGESIQCGRCRGEFHPRMIDYDPAEEKRIAMESFRRVLLLSMLGTGRVEGPYLENFRLIIYELFSEAVADEEIVEDVTLAEQRNIELLPYVREVARLMPPAGRLKLVESVARLLSCEGRLAADDRRLLEQVALANGLDGNQLRMLLEALPALEGSAGYA